jgi:ABC-2 type transport system permease protein
VDQKYKTASFYSLLMTILACQAVIFALFILIKGDMFISLLSFLAGIVFSYVFVYFYAKNRLKA